MLMLDLEPKFGDMDDNSHYMAQKMQVCINLSNKEYVLDT